jgi:glycosyltransferase involved in cell wall biosynthesis
MIYADQRWMGNHGIGRFARHVLPAINGQPVPLTSNPAAPFDSLRLARALRNLSRDDLFFSPGYNTPLYCRCPFIFTIHDLSHVYCPENTSVAIQVYYAMIMKRACKRADRILTVSEFTKNQIIQWSGVPPGKVFNVGCGVDAVYRPDGDVYGLPYPCLLCVSNRKRHKNEFRIVEAFARAQLGTEIHLVFTGHPCSDLVRWVDLCGVSDRVNFVGVIPEERLPSLYRGAIALVFASLYEGFGLPIVEAMACGTPVVTSNVAAMPEVAGDAALLVNPTSVDEIASAIKNVACDDSLRMRLKEKGLTRATKFSWSTTCQRIWQIVAGK